MSCRSKLSGIYALVSVVNSLCSYYKITGGSVTIGCNGDSALKKSFSALPVDMDDKDKDIIAAIQSKVTRSPISWKMHYVKGLQDRTSQKLDEWAQLNIAMGTKAKLFWR